MGPGGANIQSIGFGFSIEPASILLRCSRPCANCSILKLLAEQGSFGRAAEAAHVTQPTLSSGIQELERTLGAPVVDRARSGVILTAVGEEALRRATVILNETEELVEAAKNAGQPLTGRFRLGVIPTVAPFLLPRALPLLRERFPKLRLFLREDLTQRLIAALKAGQLDAALIALPFDMHGLNWAPVSDDVLLAAMPAGHPLARLKSADPQALESVDMILLEDGHCLRDHALAACGLKPPKAGARARKASRPPLSRRWFRWLVPASASPSFRPWP